MDDDPVTNDPHFKVFPMTDRKTLFIDVRPNGDKWEALCYERGSTLMADGAWQHKIICQHDGFDNEKEARETILDLMKSDPVYGPYVKI